MCCIILRVATTPELKKNPLWTRGLKFLTSSLSIITYWVLWELKYSQSFCSYVCVLVQNLILATFLLFSYIYACWIIIFSYLIRILFPGVIGFDRTFSEQHGGHKLKKLVCSKFLNFAHIEALIQGGNKTVPSFLFLKLFHLKSIESHLKY